MVRTWVDLCAILSVLEAKEMRGQTIPRRELFDSTDGALLRLRCCRIPRDLTSRGPAILGFCIQFCGV
jgi:hypothetical protein